MTTDELLAILAQEYPKGISFDPMAVRLLRQKISLEDWQIQDLKAAMFQVEGGIWFSCEMVANDNTLSRLAGQAANWLKEYGCFSVKRLFEEFRHTLSLVTTPADFLGLLQYLQFTAVPWGKAGIFCTLPRCDLDESLKAVAATITELINEAEGILAFHVIEQAVPCLTAEDLEHIRAYFLSEVHTTEFGGVPCWCTSEAIMLPDDFPEKLTNIVDTLKTLNEKVSIANLDFALNLFYRMRFREEHALMNNDIFLSICEKHYQGDGVIFAIINRLQKNANGDSISKGRTRSRNTRFLDLGIPVGTQLIFTHDNMISCTVADEINQVQYDGKVWAISSLAMHLLGTSSPKNGFDFFTYMGEVLWTRRVRLEQEGNSGGKTPEASHPANVQDEGGKILGLSGQILSASTWRSFKRDGTSLRVKEWALRALNGESVEQIAKESGYAVPTMKGMISNYHLYFKVCKLNGIKPEGSTDV
jgi:hypothetical protein